MAEPIRKPLPPPPHLPARRPRPRLAPAPRVRLTGLPLPALSLSPRETEPPAPPRAIPVRPLPSRAFPRHLERKRRTKLLVALGAQVAALLLPVFSIGVSLTRSELLLGVAVLVAGGAVLALGASGSPGRR